MERQVIPDPLERRPAGLKAFYCRRNGRQIVGVGAFACERSRLSLKHQPRLRKLTSRGASPAIFKVERLEPAVPCIRTDERPAARFDFDQAAFGERTKGLANDGAAHTEVNGQAALRGQALVSCKLPGEHALRQDTRDRIPRRSGGVQEPAAAARLTPAERSSRLLIHRFRAPAVPYEN